MSDLLSILAFGFWLGIRHASDGDHVAAVSTLVSRNKKSGTAWLLGAFWGLGHSLTIFLSGAVIILLKLEVPSRVGLALEFGVGLLLMALGALNMAGFRLGGGKVQAHSHAHDHADPGHRHEAARHRHDHPHLHGPPLGKWRSLLEDVGPYQAVRSLAVGVVHGLAGSAAAALLVLGSIPDPAGAVLYLLVFGLGTLAGMLILSALMEYSMTSLARWWGVAERGLNFGTGLLSLLFGLYVAYQAGWEGGLFRAETRWTPH